MTYRYEAETKILGKKSYSDPIFDTANTKFKNEPKCNQYSTLYFRSPDGRYIMEMCHGMQVTEPADRQWNTIFQLVLSSLGFSKRATYHALTWDKHQPHGSHQVHHPCTVVY